VKFVAVVSTAILVAPDLGDVASGLVPRLPAGSVIYVRADQSRADQTQHGWSAGAAERSAAFRGYLLWLTFPPMLLLFLDKPFALTLVYGVLGAFFMPFLAITLLVLLNSRRVPGEHRSGWLSNLLLTGSGALFVVLLVNQLAGG
jgi:Mn2+/Fe2+ NRAMP family transporter